MYVLQFAAQPKRHGERRGHVVSRLGSVQNSVGAVDGLVKLRRHRGPVDPLATGNAWFLGRSK
jgi:hypothetical protein